MRRASFAPPGRLNGTVRRPLKAGGDGLGVKLDKALMNHRTTAWHCREARGVCGSVNGGKVKALRNSFVEVKGWAARGCVVLVGAPPQARLGALWEQGRKVMRERDGKSVVGRNERLFGYRGGSGALCGKVAAAEGG
jgi:hypothetical protein